MKIVPVLDLLDGQVVHGVGGERQDYRPIKSKLTDGTNPLDVAAALHRHFGFTEFYVADLDAIGGAEPSFSTFAGLRAAGFRLWVDAGVVRAQRALDLAAAGVDRIIAGLETLTGPDVLTEVCRAIPDRTVFSLDLRAGQPVRANERWNADPWAVLEQAIGVGVGAVLLVDVARVGMRSGTGTEELCARVAAAWPHIEVIAGGGIRNRDDLARLERAGVRAALMATALHDGSLPPLAALHERCNAASGG
jgi:phosphoribosylformimino-5-aminoimidazole carboxamide ribotide isomerase